MVQLCFPQVEFDTVSVAVCPQPGPSLCHGWINVLEWGHAVTKGCVLKCGCGLNKRVHCHLHVLI